jgi:hypothetical protein
MRILLFCLVLLPVAGCAPPSTSDDDAGDSLKIHAGESPSGPRLSTGPDGTVVLSWMEPDASGTTLWYSRLSEDGWQPSRSVVSGVDMFVNWADMPSVTALTATHWVAHWLEMAGPTTYAYHVVISQSFDGGGSWSAPVKPHTDGTPTEHGFVSLFPLDDKVAAIWLDGRKTGADHSGDASTSGMTLRSAVIDSDNSLSAEQEIDGLICDCCQTDVAVTDAGPVAVYRDRTVDEIRDIYVSRHSDGQWQQGLPVNNDNWEIAGCPVNGPAIAANDSNVVVAWFSAPEQRPAVRVRFSDNSGETFGPVAEIATTGSLGHVDVVMLADNSAVLSWLQTNGNGLADLVFRHVGADGQMGEIRTIASNAPARSVPQMALDDSHLVFVWTEAIDSSKRIASTRVNTATLIP